MLQWIGRDVITDLCLKHYRNWIWKGNCFSGKMTELTSDYFLAKNKADVNEHQWRRKWLPTPGFLPGKSHGQRSLESYSPWGLKTRDMTWRLSMQHEWTAKTKSQMILCSYLNMPSFRAWFLYYYISLMITYKLKTAPYLVFIYH